MLFLVPVLLGAVWAAPAGAEDGHTVSGRVTVLTKEGTPREDLSNVIVSLRPAAPAAAFPAPSKHPEMRQQGRKFQPEVLPIVVGTTVDFPNDDTIQHNVFSLSKIKPFDLGMYRQETVESVTFDQPGLVKIYCNIHPQMAAYVLVLESPWFAVTSADGSFSIAGVPEGEYMLHAWQRFGPEQSASLRVPLDPGAAPVELALTEEQVSIKHNNKWGKPYPTKTPASGY